MQYLSTRYENGKAKVGEFMQKRHCTVQHKNIMLAHGDVVEKQAELGPSTLLAANLLTFSFCFFCCARLILRLTILVVDNTLWPQRDLASRRCSMSKYVK